MSSYDPKVHYDNLVYSIIIIIIVNNKSFIADNCPYTYIKKFKNTSTKIQHRKLKLMK